MNYAIEEYVFNDYNASSKARKDVSYFIHQFGFKTLIKNDKSQKKYGKIAKAVKALQVFVKVFTLNKNDVLFIQTSQLLLKPILRIKRIRKFKIIYLIHDVFSLCYNTERSIREHRNEIEKDIDLLNGCDCVIAHNQFMIDRLRELGCKTSLVSLEIFDYACSLPPKQKIYDSEKIEVVYAGNPKGALFLNGLEKLKDSNIKFVVYGGDNPSHKNIIYKGCVDADILPSCIEGNYGLIWSGEYKANKENNYTFINNPHKLSMYIAANLPAIALEGTAAGNFIKTNQIGITINDLDQLPEAIHSINKEEYTSMLRNCSVIRGKIIKGQYLESAINQCLNILLFNK